MTEDDDQATFRSDFTVELVRTTARRRSVLLEDQQDPDIEHYGLTYDGDDGVLEAMLVSTGKDRTVSEMSPEAKRGRIRFLMQNRHGTPFEHNSMIFRSEAPIFVYREWHRHRIGISINEMSGRYTELPGVFYIPPPQRPLVQVGKPGHYTYEAGTPADYEWLRSDMQMQAVLQYESYKKRLRLGYAKEVARMSLGVNIYSSMYWTCNARSLMAFLSLRTRREPFWIPTQQPLDYFMKNPGGAMFPSGPMWEIEASANALEQVFATLFPITYEAWNEFGRVCP